MPTITIPFLPKLRLVEFLQTQCQVDADSPRGPFNGALDLDVSHIDALAMVDRVTITDVDITQKSVVVSYDVHYRIFDGCMRISAIVDTCFGVIVDGVSEPSWTRRGCAQARS